ncbi:PREDICTED: ras-related protein Rab-38 isoform X2 [Nicrophorus vespilloides]|nr:PREDICTED: ras-related protein Rab-38 isoform X2 [Nicrophorus vespilloides]
MRPDEVQETAKRNSRSANKKYRLRRSASSDSSSSGEGLRTPDKLDDCSELADNTWNSVEALNLLPEDKPSTSKSVITIENTKIELQSDHTISRTKSLENVKKMPAYGDLILDSSTTSPQNNGKLKDSMLKILVIGDLATGKTSFIKRYVHDFFSQTYRATIGVDFALKILHLDDKSIVRVQLWDVAGQENIINMTRVFYNGALAAFIVFDVTRTYTLESVAKWKADLDSKVQLPDGSPVPCILLGNKCDQQREGIVNNPAKMDEYCKEHGFTAWYEISAKENINIQEAANALISKILQNDELLNDQSSKDKEQFTLTSKDNSQKGKKCYKC